MLAADWDKTHTSAPELNGQLFHFFDAPNRFGLPPFDTLHVRAWKDNPNGTFTTWNPNVSCDGFNGQTPSATHPWGRALPLRQSRRFTGTERPES